MFVHNIASDVLFSLEPEPVHVALHLAYAWSCCDCFVGADVLLLSTAMSGKLAALLQDAVALHVGSIIVMPVNAPGAEAHKRIH